MATATADKNAVHALIADIVERLANDEPAQSHVGPLRLHEWSPARITKALLDLEYVRLHTPGERPHDLTTVRGAFVLLVPQERR